MATFGKGHLFCYLIYLEVCVILGAYKLREVWFAYGSWGMFFSTSVDTWFTLLSSLLLIKLFIVSYEKEKKKKKMEKSCSCLS